MSAKYLVSVWLVLTAISVGDQESELIESKFDFSEIICQILKH